PPALDGDGLLRPLPGGKGSATHHRLVFPLLVLPVQNSPGSCLLRPQSGTERGFDPRKGGAPHADVVMIEVLRKQMLSVGKGGAPDVDQTVVLSVGGQISASHPQGRGKGSPAGPGGGVIGIFAGVFVTVRDGPEILHIPGLQ